MIIRMTVEDNDFTEMLEDFANDLRKFFFQETKSNYENVIITNSYNEDK